MLKSKREANYVLPLKHRSWTIFIFYTQPLKCQEKNASENVVCSSRLLQVIA